MLEDHEEAFLRQYMEEVTPKNVDYIVCTETAKYCDDEGDANTKAENTERVEL